MNTVQLIGNLTRDPELRCTAADLRLFSQEELRSWIEQTLGTRPVAAAPGIFYVFRSPEDAQALLASRLPPAGRRGGAG
jgi:hypothetical protein